MAALTDQQLAQLTNLINTRPDVRDALLWNANRPNALQGRTAGMYRDPRTGMVSQNPGAQGPSQGIGGILRKYGLDLPDAEDYSLTRDPQTGQMGLQHHNYFQRNADWIIPVSFAGGAAAGMALSGGAAAAPEIAVTGSSSSAPVVAPVTAAGITGGTTGGTAAGIGGGAAAGTSIYNTVKNGADTANNLNHSSNTQNLLGTLGALLPLLLRRSAGSSNGSTDGGGPFGKDTNSEIAAMFALQNQRLKQQAPVREAALRMAMSMAPSAATSPRLTQAVTDASSPRPMTAQDPQVTAALQRLMGGG